MKKMLLALLLAFVSQVSAQTPCSQTERASATDYGALAAPSGTQVSSVLQACENPGEAEEAEPEASVYDDAIALWKLDETSDGSAPVVRVDSIGSLDLTDNNTVASAAKGVGAPANLPDTVASFVAGNAEYLSQISATGLGTGDFTLSFWVYPTEIATGDPNYVGRGFGSFHNSDVTGDWMIGLRPTGKFAAAVWENNGADTDGVLIGDGTYSINEWHHVVFRRSSGVKTLWVNGVSQSLTTATTATGWVSGKLNIGNSFTSGVFYWSGLISAVARWDVALSDVEIAALYNSGDGAPLP